VVLQQGEDVLAQVDPFMPQYPTLAGEANNQARELLQPMVERLLLAAEALGPDCGEDLFALVQGLR